MPLALPGREAVYAVLRLSDAQLLMPRAFASFLLSQESQARSYLHLLPIWPVALAPRPSAVPSTLSRRFMLVVHRLQWCTLLWPLQGTASAR